jgi:hypothetical protein
MGNTHTKATAMAQHKDTNVGNINGDDANH